MDTNDQELSKYHKKRLKEKEKIRQEIFNDAESLVRKYGNRSLKKSGIDSIIKSEKIKIGFLNYLKRLYALEGYDKIQELKDICMNEKRSYFLDVFNSFNKNPEGFNYERAGS